MGESPKGSKEYLSRAEVAEILKVSPNTVTRWAEAGKLPYIRTLGGHRRYIKEAVQELARSLLQEGEGVKTLTLHIPEMYGDHHVINVRRTLSELPGVEEIWASAAFYQAKVTFNPEVISAEEIVARLAQAGYPSATPVQTPPGISGNGHRPQEIPKGWKDPAWDKLGIRMTQTNRADIEMSGDFRRY